MIFNYLCTQDQQNGDLAWELAYFPASNGKKSCKETVTKELEPPTFLYGEYHETYDQITK